MKIYAVNTESPALGRYKHHVYIVCGADITHGAS